MNGLSESATNLLQSVLTASQNGVMVYHAVRSPEGAIIDFRLAMLNVVAQRDFGRPATDVLGQLFSQLFPATTKVALFDQYRRVIETGQSIQFEFHYTRSGRKAPDWFDLSVVPMQDGIVVSYDVTTQAKADADAARQISIFEKAFNSSISGITVYEAIYDEDGHISDFRFAMINEAGLRMSGGYTREDLLGQTVWQIYPATRINGLFDHYVAVCETGDPISGEKYYPEYDTWRDYSIVPVSGGIMVTYTDITASKKLEENARHQAQLVTGMLEAVPVGLIVLEAVRDNTPQHKVVDFRYRRANQINYYLTGYSEAYLLGKDMLALFPRLRGTELETALRDVLETGRTQRMIFDYYTDKTDRWFDAQFSRLGDDSSADSVLMTYLDVTEQHKAQLAQKVQADLFQTIINELPASLVLFDPVRETTDEEEPGTIIDFTYVLVNETRIRVTGHSARSTLGKRWRALQPEAEDEDLFRRLVVTADSGQPQEWLLETTINGNARWFQTSLTRHGRQVLLTYLDVSDLKAQQQALETANLNLHRSNENLQQFAYVASHDLQEPLRKIQSFGDLLSTNYQSVLDENGQDIIRRMKGGAERMSALIRDLLLYSRLTTQRAPYNRVSLSAIVGQVLQDVELIIQETGASIELGELADVTGDPAQLEQLMQNLLTNALKFRREGITPHIRVYSQRILGSSLPVGVVMKDKLSHQYEEINVSDNGIGFDIKYIDRIFQIFQRLHGKNVYAGSGIGLSICLKIAQNHDGGITATSQPGTGATFSLYLPVEQST